MSDDSQAAGCRLSCHEPRPVLSNSPVEGNSRLTAGWRLVILPATFWPRIALTCILEGETRVDAVSFLSQRVVESHGQGDPSGDTPRRFRCPAQRTGHDRIRRVVGCDPFGGSLSLVPSQFGKGEIGASFMAPLNIRYRLAVSNDQ